MPHVTSNPHDAEETMRPHLGRLHDAEERVEQLSGKSDRDLQSGSEYGAYLSACDDETAALWRALDKALELLGVRR